MILNEARNMDFAQAIVEGISLYHYAQSYETQGYSPLERNIGGTMNRFVTDERVESLGRMPNLDEEISKKMLEYDNPNLEEWAMEEWRREGEDFKKEKFPLTQWIINVALVCEVELTSLDAGMVAKRMIQILYDEELAEQAGS